MGKIGQGILGGISGKVGNVIGASWKGIHYLRIKPTSVANPRTEGQVNQRNKFSATGTFIRATQAFVKLGFKFYQNKQSAQNAAMAYNLRNAIAGTAPDFEVNYAAALVSRGKLAGASVASTDIVGTDIDFSWTDNSAEGNARPDDVAMLLVYNANKKEAVSLLEGTRRDAGTGTVTVSDAYAGDDLHFYMAFKAADGSAVSNSDYLGSGVII